MTCARATHPSRLLASAEQSVNSTSTHPNYSSVDWLYLNLCAHENFVTTTSPTLAWEASRPHSFQWWQSINPILSQNYNATSIGRNLSEISMTAKFESRASSRTCIASRKFNRGANDYPAISARRDRSYHNMRPITGRSTTPQNDWIGQGTPSAAVQTYIFPAWWHPVSKNDDHDWWRWILRNFWYQI